MYEFVEDIILEVRFNTRACTNLTGEHTWYFELQKHWTTYPAYEWYWENHWRK